MNPGGNTRGTKKKKKNDKKEEKDESVIAGAGEQVGESKLENYRGDVHSYYLARKKQ